MAVETVKSGIQPTSERRADPASVPVVRPAIAYPILVGLPALGIFLVLRVGATLAPSSAGTAMAMSDSPGLAARDIVLRLDIFLAQIVIILALAQIGS